MNFDIIEYHRVKLSQPFIKWLQEQFCDFDGYNTEKQGTFSLSQLDQMLEQEGPKFRKKHAAGIKTLKTAMKKDEIISVSITW